MRMHEANTDSEDVKLNPLHLITSIKKSVDESSFSSCIQTIKLKIFWGQFLA